LATQLLIPQSDVVKDARVGRVGDREFHGTQRTASRYRR
jgi:hypothetical protein